MSRANDIEESAAHFVVRSEEPSWSAADQAHLDRWLDESDAHKVAFWRLQHGWREADRIGSMGLPKGNTARTPIAGSTWTRMVAIAACLGIFIIALAIVRPNLGLTGQEHAGAVSYETSVGGHKTVALADGSQIELNTDTLVKASPTQRAVWLQRGEAYFTVAHSGGRPFNVNAGERSVVVLGTQFVVRMSGDELSVAVVQGKVRLEDRMPVNGSQRMASITAGKVAVVNESGLLIKTETAEAMRDLLSWRSGSLVFNDVTLEDAAAQFNRYSRRKLVIADAKAAKIRIGGSFDARNVDAFAGLLNSAYGLKVQTAADRISVSS